MAEVQDHSQKAVVEVQDRSQKVGEAQDRSQKAVAEVQEHSLKVEEAQGHNLKAEDYLQKELNRKAKEDPLLEPSLRVKDGRQGRKGLQRESLKDLNHQLDSP